jgi:RNA polymerase sigma factor for flagellar operon FliA
MSSRDSSRQSSRQTTHASNRKSSTVAGVKGSAKQAPARVPAISAKAATVAAKRSDDYVTRSAATPVKTGGSGVTKRARSAAAATPVQAEELAKPASRRKPAAQTAAAMAAVSVEVEAGAPAPVSPAAKRKASAEPRSISKSTSSAAAAARAAKAPKFVPLSERPIDQIWREYRTNPTTEVRNFLIARHLDLVAYAAERLHKRLPSEVEINDLKSAGAFGLMDAVDGFDPDRGVKFETFCTQRIRGAMFDELRSMDWVPRLVRSRTAKVEKVRKSIEMETGCRATEDEVATRLNVSGEEFEKLQKDSRPVSMVSLTRKCFETDSSKDVREIDVVEDQRQENPLQAVQKQDLQALITKGLSRAERLIVVLYYYEEMTMKEIGATLDLSESRVSQMHSSILARLKAQMQHRETTEE